MYLNKKKSKAIGDKLKLIHDIASQYKNECNEIR